MVLDSLAGHDVFSAGFARPDTYGSCIPVGYDSRRTLGFTGGVWSALSLRRTSVGIRYLLPHYLLDA
jgi:hypothetical protein